MKCTAVSVHLSHGLSWLRSLPNHLPAVILLGVPNGYTSCLASQSYVQITDTPLTLIQLDGFVIKEWLACVHASSQHGRLHTNATLFNCVGPMPGFGDTPR